MADRIQPRRDTAARWAAENPVLLEGEWGIVTDSPSQYKIGDGVTPWNSLPLRGYDGNLVQTTGNETKSVMSQDAVTKALAAQKNHTDTKVKEVADNLTAAEQRIEGEINEVKQEATDNYATKTGEYKELTAGFAYEILGDGQATNEKFSFRPTGGPNRNVRDGSARIEVLKGNSVVWNQIIPIQSNSLTQTVNGVTLTDNRDGSYSVSTTSAGATADASFTIKTIYAIGSEHKWFFSGCPNGGSTSTYYVNVFGGIDIGNGGLINYGTYGGVYVINVKAGCVITNAITFRPKLVDLTKMFGAGNEPTTVEQFYELLPEGVDINAYNGGEIVDANYKGIKTTGFNQFNGTYAKVLGGVKYYLGGTYTSIGYTTEEGGTTEAITIPSDKFYTPSQNGYIYAQGTDICINIAWDEYSALNGTYKPYKPFERDLSWVAKYFPNGMRSAGNVADEIRFNSTTQQWEAVQRVAVKTFTSASYIQSVNQYGIVNVILAHDNGWMQLYQNALFDTLTRQTSLIGNTQTEGYLVAETSEGVTLYARLGESKLGGSTLEAANNYLAKNPILCNYELAEPIVTPITEDVNLAYDVADYGTEQLIVAEGAQSAPLSAEIVYEPNVLASIKQVAAMLTRLDALETAMATMQASAVVTTNEE